MVGVTDVRKAYAFVAVIHKENVDNEKRFKRVVNECKLAKAVGKPMYALVKKGVDIGMLNDMPWKKIVHFTHDFQIQGILTFIDNDILVGGFYT